MDDLLLASNLDDARAAGFLLSISVAGQMAGCLAAPPLATRGRDQRPASCVLYGLVAAGLAGCLYAPLEPGAPADASSGFPATMDSIFFLGQDCDPVAVSAWQCADMAGRRKDARWSTR